MNILHKWRVVGVGYNPKDRVYLISLQNHDNSILKFEFTEELIKAIEWDDLVPRLRLELIGKLLDLPREAVWISTDESKATE